MSFDDPPDDDEIELSVFGPGRGEACLIHVGNGEWLAIDSCTESGGRSVPALDYLHRCGVPVDTAVKLVAASHAHDDHIAGISRMFEAATSSFFVLPIAMTPEEFSGLIVTDERLTAGLRFGIYREYAAVAEVLASRPSPMHGVKATKHALEGRVLLAGSSWSIRALSPSDSATTRAMAALMSSLPVAGEQKRRPLSDPNELAAAFWVEAGGKAIWVCPEFG